MNEFLKTQETFIFSSEEYKLTKKWIGSYHANCRTLLKSRNLVYCTTHFYLK